MLLVREQLKNEQALAGLRKPIDTDPDWQKALRFATEEHKQRYHAYAESARANEAQDREAARLKSLAAEYEKVQAKENAGRLFTAYDGYSRLGDYRDSKQRAELCVRKWLVAERAAAEKKLAEEKAAAEKTLQEDRDKLNVLQNELAQAKGLFGGRKRKELQEQIEQKKEEIKAASNKWESMNKQAESGAADREETGLLTEQELALFIAVARDKEWTADNFVTFGTYPQIEAGKDKTAIEWRVLARNGSRAFLISRYGLDAKPYNKEQKYITWETCTLRTWLNGEFLYKAFSATEQKAIQTVTVDNSRSQGYSSYKTNSGNNTQDKVFLLSYTEAWQYFKSDSTRACAPTGYAITQDARTSSDNRADGRAAGVWWLRSPGYLQNYASSVYYDGSRNFEPVNNANYIVRPALWVDIDLLAEIN